MSSVLASATSGNTSFSERLPGLQLAVDSHSLGAFKICPRWYFYTIILGLSQRQESVHLTFGLLMHKGREVYYLGRASGARHEEAVEQAVEHILVATWNRALARPWASDDPNKNRGTLLRTLVWYLDKYGPDDPLRTIVLSDGRPAVELHFQFDSGYRTSEGEPVEFCGWIDRLATLNGLPYIDDLKTSKSTISASWFSKFTPFNQFSMYVAAGQVAFAQRVQGLIVDGVQVAVQFSRFERGLVPRPQQVIEEWIVAQGHFLRQMETCAERGQRLDESGEDPAEAWPMNDTACDRYGGCPARVICSRSPGSRKLALDVDFKRRVWDPQVERGDI